MTLWRWRKRGFPQPIDIAGGNYYRRAEVVRWREEKARAGKAARTIKPPAEPTVSSTSAAWIDAALKSGLLIEYRRVKPAAD